MELAAFNSAVVKHVEVDGVLHPLVVPWSRLIVDQFNFDANPKIETIELTEAELYQRIKTHGYDADTASSPGAVLSALEKRDYDALLLDMNYMRDTTSGKEGLDVLQQLGGLEPDLPIIVMTAWGSVEGAVEAMRRGARDYIEKPWDNSRLMTILGT